MSDEKQFLTARNVHYTYVSDTSLRTVDFNVLPPVHIGCVEIDVILTVGDEAERVARAKLRPCVLPKWGANQYANPGYVQQFGPRRIAQQQIMYVGVRVTYILAANRSSHHV